MTTDKPSIDEIFLTALERSVAERSAYLDEICGENTELRARAEKLLDAQLKVDSFLESPAPELGATVGQPVSEKPGTQIGPYKLLQQLGEGGMGVVYMAEQKEPVKRRVALKIIKAGMDTRQVIARFEAERQALAMMDHPNIAKALDAGATESGRPYFVMELVNGVSITQYCDEQHLTPKERLELFVPICQAVQHAHQKGIIHRDLKPSNILVAEYDHHAVPKIIDFGVAKATSQTLTEKTMFTQLGQIVGTLEYMSPEQAKRNQLDVDTRSDIYSLGVVLYELLTGETPFDRERLRSAAFDEMLRIIREEEPSKPSTRVSSSQSLPSIAANRRIDPAKLGSMIRGELDWIVLKALEKERNRRYGTANQFAEDVQHFLRDEPVVACPPSSAYLIRKFVRRNKAAAVVTSVIVLCLALLSVAASVAASRFRALANQNATLASDLSEALENAEKNLASARRQETNAIENERLANEERSRAESNLQVAVDALNEVYLNTIGNRRFHPNETVSDIEPDSLTPRERLLLRNALHFYSELASQNAHSADLKLIAAKARIRAGTIQALIYGIGDHQLATADSNQIELAKQYLSEATETLKRLIDEDPGNADYFMELGNAYTQQGHLAQWNPSSRHPFVKAVEAYSRVIELRPDDAAGYDQRAKAHSLAGNIDQQFADLHKSLALEPTAVRNGRLAGLYRSHPVLTDKLKALYHAQEAVRLDPASANRQAMLGNLYSSFGDYAKALEHCNNAIRITPKDRTPYIYRSGVYRKMGEYQKALADAETALRLWPDFWSYRYRSAALRALGRKEEALLDLDHAIQSNSKAYYSYTARASLLVEMKQYEDALPDLAKAIELQPRAALNYVTRAWIFIKLEDLDQAEANLERALELDPDYHMTFARLGDLRRVQKNWQAAYEAYSQYFALRPPSDQAWILPRRGQTLFYLERFDECLQDLTKTMELDPEETFWNWIPIERVPQSTESFQDSLLDLLAAALRHPETDQENCSNYRDRLVRELETSKENQPTESRKEETSDTSTATQSQPTKDNPTTREAGDN